MSKDKNLWHGLQADAAKALSERDYATASLSERLAHDGVEAGEIVSAKREDVRATWIPGVEIFARKIYPQRFRGVFGEFARRDEGVLAQIKLWPQQWATARMFAQSAKGFHVHPPFVPEGEEASKYLPPRFAANTTAARDYEREQWDVMFIVQGQVEMILRDVRAGFPARTMRLFVDGDNHRGANNAGIVIPPGVAHALRVEGNEDAIMVYGTSTNFRADFEGRIAGEIESAPLPESWQRFLAQ
ncbi:MAG: hypothetical protein M3R59_08975 [Verrucomicrobiota bacterium]|nr:hypothetical protein [Verrucomicrobiota bacterium]